MHRLTAQLAELRHDLAPQRTTAPDALVPGETTSLRATPARVRPNYPWGCSELLSSARMSAAALIMGSAILASGCMSGAWR